LSVNKGGTPQRGAPAGGAPAEEGFPRLKGSELFKFMLNVLIFM